MITIEKTIVFSLGAIVGFLVRSLIDHLLAKSRTEEDRRIKGFNDAATKFRSTIINELVGLYPIPIDWPRDVAGRLNATFPKIQAAVEEFKPFVPTGEVKAFNKAWLQYYTHCKHTLPEAENIATRIFEIEKSKQSREVFKYNVDLLLSFAKIT